MSHNRLMLVEIVEAAQKLLSFDEATLNQAITGDELSDMESDLHCLADYAQEVKDGILVEPEHD